MIRVVLDTNVLASGFVAFRQAESVPASILARWRSGEFELVCSEHILAELERTLHSTYFHQRLSAEQVSAALDLVRRESVSSGPIDLISSIATHPEDDPILATAVAGGADYLVTGDRQLQALGTHQGVMIISPRGFLERLATPSPDSDPSTAS